MRTSRSGCRRGTSARSKRLVIVWEEANACENSIDDGCGRACRGTDLRRRTGVGQDPPFRRFRAQQRGAGRGTQMDGQGAGKALERGADDPVHLGRRAAGREEFRQGAGRRGGGLRLHRRRLQSRRHGGLRSNRRPNAVERICGPARNLRSDDDEQGRVGGVQEKGRALFLELHDRADPAAEPHADQQPGGAQGQEDPRDRRLRPGDERGGGDDDLPASAQGVSGPGVQDDRCHDELLVRHQGLQAI